MAEYDKNRDNRKKKFFSPKEKDPILRRPVILVKSDRESNRDTERDKHQRERTTVIEKDKQPVILIKAREPSATKEAEAARPHSPKKADTDIEIETQIIHPTKIAQNESKDKKKPLVTEVNSLIPPTPMPHSLKLIDESHEFHPMVAEYLQDTNTGFLVVGVIGSQGVGKSTILNILAHSHDISDISEKILKSHEDDTQNSNFGDSEASLYSQADASAFKSLEDDLKLLNMETANKKESKNSFAFKCQNIDQIERGDPCTSGIDIYVTDSRVILLDTAASGGCGLSRAGAGVTAPGGTRGGGGGAGLEAAALLLAVCHVVILVQDWFTDVNILRFIQSAEMVKPAIPAASNPNQSSSHQNSTAVSSSVSESGDSQVHREYYPHLLFLQNKCSAEDFKPTSVTMMQDLYRKAFHKSKMHIESGMYMCDQDSNDDSCSIDGLFHNLNARRCGKPVNLFLMPSVDEDLETSDVYRGHPTIAELAQRLRWQVFGVTRNPLTNVQLTERSWLQYCNKAWDNIRKSTFFIEYGRLLP